MALSEPPTQVELTLSQEHQAGSESRFRSAASSPYIRFVLRRLGSMLIILALLVTVVFAIVRLIPGDPGTIIGGTTSTIEVDRQIDHQLGVDQPLLTQYVHYWGNLAHGKLGTSFSTQQQVTNVLSQNVVPSLQLAGFALLILLLVSIPGGIAIGALTRDSRHRGIDLGFTASMSVLGAIPELLAATFLAFIFAVELRWLPVGGTAGWKSLILPVAAISLRPTAVLIRVVRVETFNALSTDYVRTARAKHLPARTIYARHVFPNVVTAALTIGGLLFADLLAGAVIVENIFARTGIGSVLVKAVLSHDYPVVQGVVLILGIVVVGVNTLVDLLLALLDPRQISRTS